MLTDWWYDDAEHWCEAERDLYCPECEAESKDAPVGLSGDRYSMVRSGGRWYYSQQTVYAKCPACEHEWDYEEDLTDA